MRWFAHVSNDNDRPDGSRGSVFRHGRAWLHFGHRGCLGCEWSFFGSMPRLGFTVDTGGERDIMLTLGFGIGALYLYAEGFVPYRWMDRDWPRSTGVELWLSELRLGVEWRHANDCWPPRKGWEWHAYILDALLGRQKYSAVELSSVATVVPMPEGSYPCTVTMERATWKRPRWPIATRVLRAKVDIPDGIPKPGKGTESYNCGPDALYGITTPARDVHEAVAAAAESVIRDRARYPL